MFVGVVAIPTLAANAAIIATPTTDPSGRAAMGVIGRMALETTTLYRPVGRAELALIRESANRRFPPRLFWQPIFYPVLTLSYATQLARDWNTRDPASGWAGFVTRFSVRAAHLARYPAHRVGSIDALELWVPAAELDAFNAAIVGEIEVVAEFLGAPTPR